MALPTTIVSDVGLAGHHPPYISSAGAIYSVVRADPNELDVKKATDPEDSWTLKDSASGPVHVGTLLGYATHQDGDVIHIIAWSAGTYEYYTFDMSTDTWGVDELMETPNDSPAQPWASLSVRSDGDVVVGYAGDTNKVKGDNKERVYYARREGGTWTVGVALDAGGDIHYGNPNVVKSPLTDDMHILWQQTTVTTDPPIIWQGVEARTLDPANASSTTVTDTLSSQVPLLGMTVGLSYEDSGTQRVLWVGSTDTIPRGRIFIDGTEDASDDIALGTTVKNTNLPSIHNNSGLEIITGAELNGTYFVLYSRDTFLDIFFTESTDAAGTTWTTPVEELGGVTVNFISANIYVRDIDTVLAYVYDDGGVQKYNEKVLIAGQTHDMML